MIRYDVDFARDPNETDPFQTVEVGSMHVEDVLGSRGTSARGGDKGGTTFRAGVVRLPPRIVIRLPRSMGDLACLCGGRRFVRGMRTVHLLGGFRGDGDREKKKHGEETTHRRWYTR